MGYLSHESFSDVNNGTISATLTVPVAADYIVMFLGCGYQGGGNADVATSIAPSTLTVGGQTINLVVERSADLVQNGWASLYVCDSTDIAAFSGSAVSGSTGFGLDWALTVLYYENIDSGVGIVDSDFATYVSIPTPLDVTLTTTSGDLVIGFCGQKASEATPSSLDTVLDTITTGTGGTNGRTLASTETATSSTTNIAIDSGFAQTAAMVALAIRETGGGGGGSTVPPLLMHLRQQGISA